jgi:putative flippase GtrA
MISRLGAKLRSHIDQTIGLNLFFRIGRYAISGGLAAVAYVLTGMILHRLGCGTLLAPYIAYLAGLTVSYAMHSRYTFKVSMTWRFFVLVCMTSCLSMVLSSALVKVLLEVGVAPGLAYVAGVGGNAAIGFIANSCIFRGRNAFSN